MPPPPNSYKLLKLLIKNSKWGLFRGHHVTIFVNYFGLLHSLSGGLRRHLKLEELSQWNNGMVE